MKIFVGWSYEAQWIEDHAIELIKSYGVEVMTGKELQGQVITAAVKAAIDHADAVVCFTTRRGTGNGGVHGTSDWVIDEIKYAYARNKDKVVEVREDGVQWPNMIHDTRQYIPLNSTDRVPALVELGKTVSRWRGAGVKLKLLPEDFIRDFRPRLQNRSYRCTYSVLRKGQVIWGPTAAEIRMEGMGLFLYANDLPEFPDAVIEVMVDIGHQWFAGIPLGSMDVVLQKF